MTLRLQSIEPTFSEYQKSPYTPESLVVKMMMSAQGKKILI